MGLAIGLAIGGLIMMIIIQISILYWFAGRVWRAKREIDLESQTADKYIDSLRKLSLEELQELIKIRTAFKEASFPINERQIQDLLLLRLKILVETTN